MKRGPRLQFPNKIIFPRMIIMIHAGQYIWIGALAPDHFDNLHRYRPKSASYIFDFRSAYLTALIKLSYQG